MFRLAILLCMVALLTGCGDTASYRYKLTLSVDTPEGVKSAHTVVEVDTSIGMDGDGIFVSAHGEALYLDLGGRPLVALMGCRWSCGERQYYNWTEKHPTKLLLRLLHGESARYTMNGVRELARHREPLTLTTADLPSLVTFEDAGRPASIKKVDPDDLSAAFGPGVTWKQMTIEVTDEPPSSGIASKLPWIAGEYQSYPVAGTKYKSSGNEVTVGNYDFRQ